MRKINYNISFILFFYICNQW